MSTARAMVVGESDRVMVKGQAKYWTEVGGRVLIADSLRDLVSSLDAPRLSPSGLAAIAQRRGGIWLTPFEGVQRLTFGHELIATREGPQVRGWLRPNDTALTDRDPVEVMREAIELAVNDCLAGDQAATLTLSGGLDSTTVAALAARVVDDPSQLRAFCAVAMTPPPTPRPGRRWNEWPLAEAVATRAGVTAEQWIDVGDDHWLDATDELHARHYWPVPAWGNVWWMRRAEREAVSAGHRVILTGQSGNATLSVGPAGLPAELGAPRGRRSPRAVLGQWRRRWRNPTSPHRSDVPVQLPQHWHTMDRWTRWCLSEPPLSSRGPWTGADVLWCDPLGSERVIRSAMSLPRGVWTDERGRRALARAVGRDLLPDEVIDTDLIGKQGADLPHLIHTRADQYERAIEQVCGSVSAASFLDLHALRRSVGLLRESDVSAQRWADFYLGAMAVGLFAAWWDEQ